MLNVDKATLNSAPGFDKGAWPDMADIAWADSIHSFYGIAADRSGAPTTGPDVQADDTGAGAGASIDPRPGTGRPGDDTDLARIRGSNIG